MNSNGIHDTITFGKTHSVLFGVNHLVGFDNGNFKVTSRITIFNTRDGDIGCKGLRLEESLERRVVPTIP